MFGGSKELVASLLKDHVGKYVEIDTDNVEPLIHINEEINNWREDNLGEVLDQEKALSNSPIKDSTYFKLPKVLDKN